MSKKDLLERISRNSADGLVRRAEGAPAQPRTADSTRTRVSRKVVRRRRRPSDPPEEAAPVKTTRRRAVEAGDPVAPVVETVDTATEAPVETAVEAPVEEAVAAPVAEEVVHAALESPAVHAEPVQAAAVEGAPVEEASAAAEPIEAAVAAAAEPAVETVAAAAPVQEAAPVPPVKTSPTEPRFAGLGKAVVMPPPGYDPSNPSAFRRHIDAQRPAPGTPPAGHTDAPRGRRRVAAGVGAPATASPADRGRPNRRPKRRDVHKPGTGWPKKRRRSSSGPKKASPAPKAQKRRIRIDNTISVAQLSHELGVKAGVVIKYLISLEMMVTLNEMLDMETAGLVAAEFDYEVVNAGFQEADYLQHIEEEEAEEEELETRPPVITVMGHVDHGKTTLLDAIRKTKIAKGEAGGITQHIGAYQVDVDGQSLTFIDTPGHAAFSAMRARGASITDIVVLVVAADDGVQPQTIEAINHAKAADVPIIVAVNKMDKEGVNPDTVKNRLGEFELIPEEWGGETLFVPVSALKGEGIDELLENIILQAEVLDLGANPDRAAEGVVIEAKMERGRGPVATVLVQTGTLKQGDFVVLGGAYGRVRAMSDHRGKKVKVAGPSMPVEVVGLSDLPGVGDSLLVARSDKDARAVAEYRVNEKRSNAMSSTRRRTAEDLFAAVERGELKTVNVVIKADVQGSLEALRNAVEALDVVGTEVRVLHAGVGNISESDVHLLAADEGLLIGFNVKVDPRARRTADEVGVKPELYKVIYAVLDRVEGALKGMLEPEYEEEHRGSAEVRATFQISKIGTIAGCLVQEGKIGRHNGARVFRNGKEIWKGDVSTLKRFKDDVKEVGNGYECGIALDGFNAIEVGDIIQTFALVVIPAT